MAYRSYRPLNPASLGLFGGATRRDRSSSNDRWIRVRGRVESVAKWTFAALWAMCMLRVNGV